MNIILQSRQMWQSQPYTPYTHRDRVRVYRQFPIMTEAEEIIDKGLMA